MGAFFLYHETSNISGKKVSEMYMEKGFAQPFEIKIGEYFLKLYEKTALKIPNYHQKDSDYIFACGSLFYKGLGYSDSLKQLLEDFVLNQVDSNHLYGNYVIIFYNTKSKKFTFCIDPSYIKNVYFDPVNKVITTDFLSLVSSFPTYTLNHLAIIENLTTGNLISPDTYVNGVYKLDQINVDEIEDNFPWIITKVFKPEVGYNFNGFDEAVDHANEQLSKYFQSVAEISNEFGAHIGLTGGFDSRLLLIHAKRHLRRLLTNSFWRENSLEYKIAKLVAKASKQDFFSFEEKPFMEPGKEEMLQKSYYFFDGQIRSQNIWEEEFNLSDYALQIASDHFVGFHGLGGEQYRNSDRFPSNMSTRCFIEFEWMFRQCGNVFKAKKIRKEVYEKIQSKIKRLVKLDDRKLGLLEMKIIQNEIWNTSNRAARVNVLNQQQFYFAPFSEFQLSRAAYNYVPYLGKSYRFQMEMMRRLDSELSSVNTNYGFNIQQGEPLKNHIITTVVNIIPRMLYYRLYRYWKDFINKGNSDTSIKRGVNYLAGMYDMIDLEKLSNSADLGKNINSFEYLLQNLSVAK